MYLDFRQLYRKMDIIFLQCEQKVFGVIEIGWKLYFPIQLSVCSLENISVPFSYFKFSLLALKKRLKFAFINPAETLSKCSGHGLKTFQICEMTKCFFCGFKTLVTRSRELDTIESNPACKEPLHRSPSGYPIRAGVCVGFCSE